VIYLKDVYFLETAVGSEQKTGKQHQEKCFIFPNYFTVFFPNLLYSKVIWEGLMHVGFLMNSYEPQ
jgi:hypothetical protein